LETNFIMLTRGMPPYWPLFGMVLESKVKLL